MIFVVASPAFYRVFSIGGRIGHTETWSVVLFGKSGTKYEALSVLGLIGWISLMVGALVLLVTLFVPGKIKKVVIIVAALLFVVGAVFAFLAPNNLL